MKNVFDEKLFKSLNIAIKDDMGNSITYLGLYEEAMKLKDILNERKLICVFVDKSFETLKFVFEMLIINQPMLMLLEDFDKDFVKPIIKDYKPFYIWKRKSSEDYVIDMNTHFLIETGNAPYEINENLALLFTTSGSTGNNKMVKISYGNLRAAYIRSKDFIFNSDFKSIAVMPINYIFSLGFCMWTWYAGATVYITENNVQSKEFYEFYKTEKINSIAIIPFILQMFDKLSFWDNEVLNQTKFVVLSGAKLTIELQKKYIDLLKEKFWIGYGQTEITDVEIAANSADIIEKDGTVGKALPGAKVSVDSSGELIVESDSVCMGYAYNYKDLIKGDENHGVMHTGDIVDIDDDGYIYIKGRKSRFVKITGKRISLDDIETILQKGIEYPLVCTGDTDIVSIYFEGQKDENAEKYCMETLHSKVHISKKMLKFNWVDKIPRNATGKILYSKLN